MAWLHIVQGLGEPQWRELRERTILGRNPDCDIIIPESTVSRLHAQIVQEGTTYYVEELKARNPTFVNDQRLAGRIALKEGDEIRIAQFVGRFYLSKPVEGLTQIELKDDEDNVFSTVTKETCSAFSFQTQPTERLRILLEITNALSQTLELDKLLPKVLEQLFQVYRQADRGFIVLVEPQSRRLIVKASKFRRPRDEQHDRPSRKIIAHCVETGQAVLSEDALTDQRFAMSESISDLRIRSVMSAPLKTSEGQVFGVIQLDTQDRLKRFSEDDLSLLVAVSNQAAVALENARLHDELVARKRVEHELEIARQVQKQFLPSQVPQVPGYAFYALYEPARTVSGDFYSFVGLPEQKLALVIGDVAGKGIPAALLMARLSAQVPYALLSEADPAASVELLNRLLCQGSSSERFVTLCLVVLDSCASRLTVVNAGHQAPLLWRWGSPEVEELGTDLSGLPLGVDDAFSYAAFEADLGRGDGLLLYTDGVIDAVNAAETPFGLERLKSVIAEKCSGGPMDVGPWVQAAVRRHIGNHAQHDDITLVCLGRDPASGSVVDTVTPSQL
ncbi:MAG: hypothetical protein C4297_10195 [Gemmataceae bacterium]